MITYKELMEQKADITYYPRSSIDVLPVCEPPKLKLSSMVVKLLEGNARKLQKSWRKMRVGGTMVTKSPTDKGYSKYLVEEENVSYTFDIAKLHDGNKEKHESLLNLYKTLKG